MTQHHTRGSATSEQLMLQCGALVAQSADDNINEMWRRWPADSM